MCTYQAENYLIEQIDSIVAQSHTHWQLFVSDDGSKDKTSTILKSYLETLGQIRLSIFRGPAKGFVGNFLSLTCKASIEADVYAYSDQDDIWDKDKLECAIKFLSSVPQNIPALYCSRSCLVDSNNIEIGLSPLFSKRPSFANALMQNIGGGNTMVFNNAARSLLVEAGQDIPVVSHDWWTYLLVTGCGGKVFYDKVPRLRYRQHDGNLVGMNSTWGARLKRIRMLGQGRFRIWNDNNILALRKMLDKLTPDNQEILERFIKAREMSIVPRLFHLKKSGIHRQTLLGNLGLIAAAIFKKI